MAVVELTISYDVGTGKIAVAGPIRNRALCLEILDIAKKSVEDYDPLREAARRTVEAINAEKVQAVPHLHVAP